MFPQLPTGIVVVGHHRVPGVFVDEQHTLAVHMAIAFLQVGLDHPHPAQLITHELGVGMVGRQQFGILDGTGVGLEGVGRAVDLALAQQLPGVALRRTVEQAVFVHGHGAVGADHRLVIAISWHLPHASGRWAVGPGLAGGGDEVVGLVGNADHTVVTGRLERGVVAHRLDHVGGFRLHGRRVGL
ncbi:hypothetical protein D3C76_911730 [compost metagenome]